MTKTNGKWNRGMILLGVVAGALVLAGCGLLTKDIVGGADGAVSPLDNLKGDGDFFTAGFQDLVLDVNAGDVVSGTIRLYVQRAPGTVFANGATVTVTFSTSQGSPGFLAPLVTAGSGTITLPTDWGSKGTGTLSDYVEFGFTFTAAPEHDGEYILHFDASGARTSPPGGTLSLNENFRVRINVAGQEPVEELTVTKTAVTSYTRTHDWSVAKSVAPEQIWLYIDGSGDGTVAWTVDVTYEGYVDSDWNVSGRIRIENTGTLVAVITNIEDLLAGSSVAVVLPPDVTLPYALDPGQILIASYSADGYVEGSNVATVTTERDTYSGTVPIVWGDPTTEVNATVDVVDSSQLFGIVTLGSLSAPNGKIFRYHRDFAWSEYGADRCGTYTYHNTVRVVGETGETVAGDTAKATVYVQCYIYESAYAKGAGAECFIPTFANWGWTNPIGSAQGMELWAAAGRCDTSKGILVGSATVNSDGTYSVELSPPYILRESHVYAGETKFPQVQQGRRTASTVAPGQYYIRAPYNWAIVHAVVGIPDPKFGP